MKRLLPVALLSLALASTGTAQGPNASVSISDCDPVWNVTLDDARGCDEGIAPRSDAPGRSPANRTRVPVRDSAQVNRALIEKAYTDFARGDVPAFLAILDPHVTWIDAEGYPYAGTYVGPDALVEGLIARIGAEWDGYTVVPTTYVADGDRVVVLGDYSGTYKATGRSVEVPFAHVWQIRDGAVVHFRQFTDGPPWQRAVTP